MDTAVQWLQDTRGWLAADPYPKSSSFTAATLINSPEDEILVSKTFPSTKMFYTDFELNFSNGMETSNFASDSLPVVMLVCVAYVVSIFALKAYMRDKKFFDVRWVQFFWNAGLAIFSIIGTIRMVPHLLLMLSETGLREAVCHVPAYGEKGASGLWTMLFVFSKVPELGDTFLIILGKRDLLFLHWYHHVSVLLFTWNSYASRSSTGVWFISMNFTVHSFMYAYFALMGKASIDQSAAKRLPDPIESEKALRKVRGLKKTMSAFAPLITALQIGQMLVGMLALYWAQGFMAEAGGCALTRVVWMSGLVMYASYFVLFALFAVNRYCLGSKASAKGIKIE